MAKEISLPYEDSEINAHLSTLDLENPNVTCMDLNSTNPTLGKALYLCRMLIKDSHGAYTIPLTLTELHSLMLRLQDKNIASIDISSSKLDDAALNLILDTLPKTVHSLELNNNNFTEIGLQKLVQFVAAHPHFTIRAEMAVRIDGKYSDYMWKGAAEAYVEPAAAGEHEASAGGAGLDIVSSVRDAAAAVAYAPAAHLEDAKVPPSYELAAENADMVLGASLPPAYEG